MCGQAVKLFNENIIKACETVYLCAHNRYTIIHMTFLLCVLLTRVVFAAAAFPEDFDQTQRVSVFTMRAQGDDVTQEIWDVRGLFNPVWGQSLWRVFLGVPLHEDQPYTAGFAGNYCLDNALEQFAVSASHAAGSDDSYLTPPGGWVWWAGPVLQVAYEGLRPGRVRIILWSKRGDLAIEGRPAKERHA